MSIRILPSANAWERHAHLTALHLQDWAVGDFAQFFWTMSVGLDYDNETLKDIFNACLDDSLPK